jgi:3-phosphoshikimate 1-carboxyvinyltransferase
VEVPGSKSVSNRALVCAALATGASTVRNIAPGDDTAAMLECLEVLGAGIGAESATVVRVDGTRGRLAPGPATLRTGLAGTTSRFVIAVAALGAGPFVIDGDPPLRRRPMTPLYDALVALGARVTAGETWGHLPVTIEGPIQRGGSVAVRGDISSQYITALMLVAPCLGGGLTIELTTPLVSAPYLQVTREVMEAFGATVEELSRARVRIAAGGYSAQDFAVEADASSASYPLAAAAIVGGTVRVDGVSTTSTQGDAKFAHVLEDMGCDVHADEGGMTVTRDGPLRGVDVDMREMSDLVPTLAVVAPFATTRTRIRGVGFIRGKESDRIDDLCDELIRVGVRATAEADGLTIEPGAPHPAQLATHHDHRLAMAFGLLGLVVDGIEIEDPDVVSKSWPGYWDMLEDLPT